MGAGCCKGDKSDESVTRSQRYGQGAFEDSVDFQGVVVEEKRERFSLKKGEVLRGRIMTHINGPAEGSTEIDNSRLLHSVSRQEVGSHASAADTLTWIASEVDTQMSSAPPSPTSQKAPWARLVCLDPTFPTIEIASERFTFGRSPDCTHHCHNSMVSHHQFALSLIDRRTASVEIEDRLSTNGTYISPGLTGPSARVEGSQSLHHGDTIFFQLGHSNKRTKSMHPGYIFQYTGGSAHLRESSKEDGEGVNAVHTHYKVGSHVLGTGGSSTVYLGLNKDTGELLAVKKLKNMTCTDVEEELSGRMQEVEILSRLNHSNIVSYIGADHDAKGRQFNVLLEFVPGGSISCLLSKFGALDECVIRNYMVQIIAGLRYLHENNVVHMDIKAANILVTAQGKCKLTDFGAACKVVAGDEKQLCQKFLGTPLWMAPEVARERMATKSSDIWSLGCTMLEMATGRHPWFEKGFENQLSVVNFQQKNTTERPLIPPNCKLTHLGREMIYATTCLTAGLRPTSDSLLRHGFITSTHFNPETSTRASLPSDGLITSSSLGTFNDFESLSIADVSPPASIIGNSQ
eukprot:TRINITY_DN1771_c1_g5_i1.p1 TRINITY_DN1771_c1_g5~~TRINITY_DN1771_c1_g5_i1.p1  ORF type:complete len:574 (+),score=96.11 TRINITY_DN1771_c1_g5_i1:141-1862(+)